MSLSQQLSSIKVSYTNTFDIDIKKKKSLIHNDGASKSRAETYLQCKEGFDQLCLIDKKFSEFECLFLEADIDKPFTLQSKDEIASLQSRIRQFLYLLTEFLELSCTLLAVEWIIFKYEAHLHQPEDLLVACLPLHERNVFIKFLRVLDLKKNDFKWLQCISEGGHGVNAAYISGLCLKNPSALEMICSWPMKVIESTNNDVSAGKRMYKMILSLSLDILDKVLLKGSEKVEKYMSPFMRFIIEGFTSKNTDFISSAAFMLVYMTYKTSVNVEFLNHSLKKFIRNDIIQDNACLRAILDIAGAQSMVLCGKIETLFVKRMSRLSEPQRSTVEGLLAKLNHEDSCCYATNVVKLSEPMDIEIEDKPKIERFHQAKDVDIVSNVINKININFESPDLEKNLIELISKNVISWYDNTSDRIANKIAIEVLRLIKKKSPEIQYKEGGIVSYLCAALMSPWIDVRRAMRHVFTKVIKGWPHMRSFKAIDKDEYLNEPLSISKGDFKSVLLTEINFICTSDSTVQCIALAVINEKNLTFVRTLSNIWSTFLESIVPQFNVSADLLKRNEIAIKSLESTKTAFQKISVEDQHAVLDSITSNLDSSAEVINKAMETLSKVYLSVENLTYLLREVTITSTKAKRNSIKKFHSGDEDDFFTEKTQNRIIVTLGAISQLNTIPNVEQVKLIQPLFAILRKTITGSTNKLAKKDENSNTETTLITNLMSAILTTLSSAEESISVEEKASLSLKIRFEDLTKCLYMFQSSTLQNLTLMVIQKLVKLELGLEHLNLSYFMNWIGSNVVPRDDQHSMKILNSVLEELLPVCVKMQQKSADAGKDHVGIIASFVKDCSGLPKHRAIMLYYNLIKSLSTVRDRSSLWIQVMFMVVSKTGPDSVAPNLCLIVPLLKKFDREEQLIAMKKVVVFLSNAANSMSKKRKLIQDEVSNSPMQKRRRTSKETVATCVKTLVIENNESEIVKEKLLSMDRNMQFVSLLKTIMNYFLMLLRENEGSEETVCVDVVTDSLRSLFGAMKVISTTPRSIVNPQLSNEVTVSIREMIESVGRSMPLNMYLELVIDLAQTDIDDTVKLKAFELLSTRLGATLTFHSNLLPVADSVLSLCQPLVASVDSVFWEHVVSCITSLVDINSLESLQISERLHSCYETIVKTVSGLSAEKTILANLYLQKYIASDNGSTCELSSALASSTDIVSRCIDQRQLNNGEVESALSLVHSLLCREDATKIDWNLLERLLSQLFELTSLESVVRRLSRPSLEYQKNIRARLSKMNDTKALVGVCAVLLGEGITRRNLTFVSGSVSLLGCHMGHLIKNGSSLSLDDKLWLLVESVISFPELVYPDVNERVASSDLRVCEEVAIKALCQVCAVVDYEPLLLQKLTAWARGSSSLDASATLLRLTILYRLLDYLSSRPARADQTMKFISGSDCVTLAIGLLRHLSVQSQPRKKRRRAEKEAVLPFPGEDLVRDSPSLCLGLVEAVCRSLRAHLVAEGKANIFLDCTDDTIDMITSVCATVASVEQLVDREGYVAVTTGSVIPLIGTIVFNCRGDESLLTPMCMGLCKYFSELSSTVLLGVLRTLVVVKDVLGATFDQSVRGNVAGFLDDCKLHDEEEIAVLAGEI